MLEVDLSEEIAQLSDAAESNAALSKTNSDQEALVRQGAYGILFQAAKLIPINRLGKRVAYQKHIWPAIKHFADSLGDEYQNLYDARNWLGSQFMDQSSMSVNILQNNSNETNNNEDNQKLLPWRISVDIYKLDGNRRSRVLSTRISNNPPHVFESLVTRGTEFQLNPHPLPTGEFDDLTTKVKEISIVQFAGVATLAIAKYLGNSSK